MLCKVKGSSKFYTRFTAPNGKRIRSSTGTENRKLAEEFEANIKERLWRAHRLGHVRHTWEEAVVAYSLGKDVSAWHLGILNKYCKGRFLDELGDVRDRLIKDRLADGVGHSTVNRTLEVYRAVLKNAERKKWGEAPFVEMLPEPTGVVRWITRDEAEKLLSELPEHLEAMVRFSLATGLREANVTGLEWSRVDLERRVAWVEAVDTKTEEPYHVPLNAEAVLILRKQIGKHPRWAFVYGRARGKKENRVVTFDRVTKINNHAWRKALKRAVIENFRVHDLRHTWASWHVQAGTPIPVLQKLGGWKTLAMVMKYAHLGQSHVAEYADNICRPRIVKELVQDNLVKVAKDA